MLWLLCIAFLTFAAHHFAPTFSLFLALKAISTLHRLKVWLIRRERRRLQVVLEQIAREKALLLAEEQECQTALTRLAIEEQQVQTRLRRYLTKL